MGSKETEYKLKIVELKQKMVKNNDAGFAVLGIFIITTILFSIVAHFYFN